MNPDDKTNLIADLGIKAGRYRKRLDQILLLADRHPVCVPTEALRRVLAGESNEQEQE